MFIVYSEILMGVVNDVKVIGLLFRDIEVLVIVDVISGFIFYELLMDDWGLDIVLVVFYKGFMMLLGLVFVVILLKVWKVINEI